MVNEFTEKEQTHISRAVEIADVNARYDAEVKFLLSDRRLLAWIMKYTVSELMLYDIETIMDCIEGEPEVSTVPVYPGMSRMRREKVTGMPTEEKIPNEGGNTYDIRFYIMTPMSERAKLIINIEAQQKFYPGYDLVTRGVFYCARMLSAQLDTEFTTDNYDEIKKVYSIWLCMDVPKDAEYTITEYRMEPKSIYGQYLGKARYDLMSVIMVCLGKDGDVERGNRLHRLLVSLMSDKLTVQQKKDILEQEYGFAMDRESDRRMTGMCNWSAYIEERALNKGRAEGIQKGAEGIIELGIEFGLSESNILERLQSKLNIPLNTAQEYFELYGKQTV